MTLSIKSIFSCLVILATASDIHTQQIKKSGRPNQLVVSKYKTTFLGEGVERSQLPIITYSPYSVTSDVSVYIQPDQKCFFAIPGLNTMSVTVKTVKQLARNIIVFVWSMAGQLIVDDTTFSILDMNACDIKKNFKIMWKTSIKNTFAVVPFEEGFDVISSDNTRRSYDANGNQHSEDAFPINSQDFSVSTLSKIPPPNHFFIIDKTHLALNLVTDDGKLVNQLLNINYLQAYSNNEQSLYSLCSFDLKTQYFVIHCFQYAEDGTEKWHNNVTLRFRAVLDVKNLAEGGLVFVALSFDGNQLSLVKMGPNQAKTWRYSGKQTFTTVKLMEFNEEDHTFILACETRRVEQKIVLDSVVLQKYSLEN